MDSIAFIGVLFSMVVPLITASFDMMMMSGQSPKCEDIRIPLCIGIGYNQTRMPNEMNHDNQEEAGLQAHQFWPLVEIKCSPDLRFFLCSIYLPICLPTYDKPLPPCKSICEGARQGCEPTMQQYGFAWPEHMQCDKFPEFDPKEVRCMGRDQPRSPSLNTTPRTPSSKKSSKVCPKGSKNCTNGGAGDGRRIVPPPPPPLQPPTTECNCQCQRPLIPLARDTFYRSNASMVADMDNCAHPCREVYFNSEEKEFANLWITLWSGLCAASTLMTLTTFFIETERFKYPERPIVFLSACYFMVSVGYLIRVVVGHQQVACDGAIVRGAYFYSLSATASGSSSLCTVVFLLVYFFGMASSLWWVVLTFTWFLAAGLKWGNEAIAGYAQYFHVVAWAVPTLQTLAVLLHNAVDGDPVAGICSVGNMNMAHLRTFVLAPLIVYLLVGTTFLVAGFISLFRIRNVIRKQGGQGACSKADKLEKLMIRIGIFSVLYTVPATIVIGCHLYENAYHAQWMRTIAGCQCGDEGGRQPLYSVLMLKYFMALAVGITSGVWIWSGKTLESWRRLWSRAGRRTDSSGVSAVLIKNRPLIGKIHPPPQYLVAAAGSGGSASLLGTATGAASGSIGSNSQHHLHHHHHVLTKQPPLSHV